jgi:hypothetical protein
MPARIFLLSPARLDGERAQLLFHPVTMFPVARRLHSTAGAPIGEIYTFLSGLYFRGKLAYAEVFARPPKGLGTGVFVITPNRGLLAPSVRITLDDLTRLAQTDIEPSAKAFREPLQKDAKAVAQALGPRGEPVLLAASPHANTSMCCSPPFRRSFFSQRSLSVGASSSAPRPRCAPGTRLCAGARSYSARRPAAEAAGSVYWFLSRSLTRVRCR